MIQNKTLLITGGTGSVGQALIDLFLSTEVKRIIVFSRDEINQQLTKVKYNNSKLDFYVGDIRDYESVNHAMKGVDYVIHTAAMKLVPFCERHPLEATKINIFGTNNVIQAAINNNVKKIVHVATDKVVSINSAYSMTKALAERILFTYSDRIHVTSVRFGNLLGSRASVIGIWDEQRKQGKPLTVAPFEMTRYAMTKKQAAELCYDALLYGENGSHHVKEIPIFRLGDLIQAYSEVHNYYNIKKIPMRPGEQMHEKLMDDFEPKQITVTELKQIIKEGI